MHTLLNTRTNKEIWFPSDIEELNPGQWLFYVNLMLKENNILAFKLKLFKKLSRLKFSWRYPFYTKRIKEEIWNDLQNKVDLMDSFFEIEDGNYIPKWLTGINLIPRYRGWTGPDSMLNNLTWGEFTHGINLLMQCKEDIPAQIIDSIFRLLYKRKHKFCFHSAAYTLKFSAFLLFRSVYELISSTPLEINGSEIDFSILFKGGSKGSNNTGWEGLRLSIAESGVFGTAKEVNQQNMWEVLIYLYKCEMEAQDLKIKNNGKFN